MIFGSGTKLEFRDYVQGTWGGFGTPAGQVDYILTKARLGEDSSEPERQLTKSLAPVREVMTAESLDFNQLLQRDLDDHRVAIKLIPYLLEKKPTGPAFFPPIVAVLLPFRHKKPTSFPKLETVADAKDDDGTTWRQEKAGDAFKVQRLLGSESKLHPANLGRLWWNHSESRLVVLDGQHRAMALLAIERTVSNSWDDSTGTKYRSFYETQVQEELKKSKQNVMDLSKIEVPVTVCWFPEETGADSRPHESARKLFVDVNKEARPPSESRIILLSDAELINILTRRMLSELRSGSHQGLLPLFGVEYDNPVVNTSRPARWSVVTNIHLLKETVDWCVFGPRELLTNVRAKKPRGRPNRTERDACMRERLGIGKIFPDKIEDGSYTYFSNEIGNTEFPLGHVDKIADRFANSWGQSVLILLSKSAPYSAHVNALNKLRSDWHITDTYLSLAHDALFGGVGIYWTLKDSYDHYLAEKIEQKSDVVRAWEALQKREDSFETYRANEYLKSGTSQNVKLSKAAYSVFNTQACQLGLVLAMGSIWELRRKDNPDGLDELVPLAEAIVCALDQYFALDHGKASDRRLVLNKAEVAYPLNQIQNMDTPQAVYFRYFWLEILSTQACKPHMSAWILDWTEFVNIRDTARRFYFELCTAQQLRALEMSNPGVPLQRLEKPASEAAAKSLRKALEKWCDVTKEEYEGWALGFKSPPKDESDYSSAADIANGEIDDEDASEIPEVASIDELIAEEE